VIKRRDTKECSFLTFLSSFIIVSITISVFRF
jgi:hypothetical protein